MDCFLEPKLGSCLEVLDPKMETRNCKQLVQQLVQNRDIVWRGFGTDLGPKLDATIKLKLDKKWNNAFVLFATHATGGRKI